MSLYKDWQKLLDSQTKETFNDFWQEYSGTEERIYSGILDEAVADGQTESVNFSGKCRELAEKYEADPVIFMGFLDGISESVKEAPSLEDIDADSDISIDILPEKLFFNMLKADADYLYSLPQWEELLGREKLAEIAEQYKRSRTYKRAEKKIGRNDPCPCGSGKKYKHCCGRA